MMLLLLLLLLLLGFIIDKVVDPVLVDASLDHGLAHRHLTVQFLRVALNLAGLKGLVVAILSRVRETIGKDILLGPITHVRLILLLLDDGAIHGVLSVALSPCRIGHHILIHAVLLLITNGQLTGFALLTPILHGLVLQVHQSLLVSVAVQGGGLPLLEVNLDLLGVHLLVYRVRVEQLGLLVSIAIDRRLFGEKAFFEHG